MNETREVNLKRKGNRRQSQVLKRENLNNFFKHQNQC